MLTVKNLTIAPLLHEVNFRGPGGGDRHADGALREWEIDPFRLDGGGVIR